MSVGDLPTETSVDGVVPDVRLPPDPGSWHTTWDGAIEGTPGGHRWLAFPLPDGGDGVLGVLGVLDPPDPDARPTREALARLARLASADAQHSAIRQRLERSEAILNATGALAKIGGWELDLTTRRVRWTEQTFRLYGLEPSDDPPLERALASYPEDERQRLVELLERAAEDGGGFDEVFRFVNAAGAERRMRSRCRAVVREGRAIRLLGTFEDVTAQMEREAALQQSEARARSLTDRLQLATEAAGIGVWDLDMRTGAMEWDPRMYAIYGTTPDAWPDAHTTWRHLIVPDDIARVDAIAARAVADARPFTVPFRVRRPDGDVRHISAHALCLTDEEGRPARMVGINYDITPIARAQEALVEQSERLQLALDGGGLGLWDWNPLTDAAVFDARWCAMLGETVETLPPAGASWVARVHPDDWPLVEAAVQDHLAGRSEQYEAEYRLRHRDGSWRRIHARGRLVSRDAEGRPTRMVGTHMDVTDRHAMAEALRRSEARFAAFMEHAPVICWIVDAADRIVYANPAFAVLLGTPIGRLVGRAVAEIFPAEAARTMAANNARVRAGGVPQLLEEAAVQPDGGVGTFLVAKFPVPGEAPGLVGGVAIDVTPMKRAETALEAERDRLRQILDGQASYVVMLEPDGRVSTANRAVLGLVGDEGTLLGRPIWEVPLFHADPEQPARVRAVVTRALAGERVRDELVLVSPDGRRAPLDTIVGPLRDADGRIVGVIASAIDIGERKALEEQLRHAQKMEAVGRLAGGIAHDFNNILTVITGYCELLQFSLPDEPTLRADVEQVHRAALRAAGLTRQLLAFSRRQVVQPRVIDVNEVVRTLEPMLRRLIGEDVELEVALAPDAGSVRADPGQLEQVLVNLVVNARDAMPEGGRIAIATARDARDREWDGVPPGEWSAIAVSDTGVGMDAETRARIFEPFFTTKELDKGTGLGLSTVHGIVTQAGGHVLVESAPGAGATFRVLLPPAAEVAADAAHGQAAAPALDGTETILLVEDDPGIRHLAAEVLRARGYTILEAPTGVEAVHRAEAHPGPLHLLLTDVVMPELSGRQVAERVTALRPEVRVLYMSGYTDDAVLRHGIQAQEVALLPKPFTLRELLRAVRERLDAPRP
ncbi:MAG: PAS domain-containing protein [Gemmatimonadales bacterium]|nr:PAS domain-containing protein [Gemmatimonadales bacterium]